MAMSKNPIAASESCGPHYFDYWLFQRFSNTSDVASVLYN
jgi:hypothetical protein